MTQTAFSFQVPDKVLSRVPALIQALDSSGWQSAKQLSSRLGWDDRLIRAVAAASSGQIISGQRGYHLVSQAPVSDVLHAANWLRHQAREMEYRAYQIEKAMHQRTA